MLPLFQIILDFENEAKGSELVGADTNFASYLSSLLSGVMMISGLLLLVYLVWGSVEWISSGGESGKIQKARDKMTQAVIGLVVLASVLAVFQLIQTLIGVEFFTFN